MIILIIINVSVFFLIYFFFIYRESNLVEPLELQIDYWTSNKSSEAKEVGKGKDPNKSTLKTNFKAVQIQRIPSPGEQPGSYLLMNYITKEKKQKSKLLRKVFIKDHNMNEHTHF